MNDSAVGAAKSLMIWAFAFFSVCAFFTNPLFPDNEVFPYYLIPGLLVIRPARISAPQAALLAGSAAVIIILSLQTYDVPAVTDGLQLVSIMMAAIIFSQLSDHERQQFLRALRWTVYMVFALIIVQKIYPPAVDFVYQSITTRTTSATEISRYSGGVPGVGAEPAYMASFLVGAYVLHKTHADRFHPLFETGIVCSVLLTASLTGSFFLALTVLIFLKDLRIAVAVGVLMAFVVYLLLSLNGIFMARLQLAYQILQMKGLSAEGITFLEEMFGSNRFVTLIKPFSSICCGAIFGYDYDRSFSPFSFAFNIFAPLHLGILFFLLRPTRPTVASICLFLLAGPVLNWMAIGGLIGRAMHFQPDRNRELPERPAMNQPAQAAGVA
jgi:hypothetical protein